MLAEEDAALEAVLGGDPPLVMPADGLPLLRDPLSEAELLGNAVGTAWFSWTGCVRLVPAVGPGLIEVPLVEASLRLAKELLRTTLEEADVVNAVVELPVKSVAVLGMELDMAVELWLEPISVGTVEDVRDPKLDEEPSSCVLDPVLLPMTLDEILIGIPLEAFPCTSVDDERTDSTLEDVGEGVSVVGLRLLPDTELGTLLARRLLDAPVEVEMPWLVLNIATAGVALTEKPVVSLDCRL